MPLRMSRLNFYEVYTNGDQEILPGHNAIRVQTKTPKEWTKLNHLVDDGNVVMVMVMYLHCWTKAQTKLMPMRLLLW